MNTNLIAVSESTINDELVQTVNARELHEFLQSKRQFSNWITYQIEAFEFTQGVDFITINNSVCSPPRKEYHISLDMAKELAMVERSAKGKEIRKYFIAVEKEYRSKQESQFKIPKTLSEALQLAADQAKQIEYQNEKIEVMTPKAEYYDQLLGSEELSDGEMTAKTLRTSRNKLYAFLKQRGVITKSNLPMQLYIDKDYMRIRNTPYNDVFGNPKMSCKIMFTQKGIQYIRMMFNELLVNVEHQEAA